MIDEKIQSLKKLLLDHPLVPKLKDRAILAGWIGGLLLIAGLSWFLTQAPRNHFLQRSVNRVLEQSGDSRRLGEPIPAADQNGSRMGVYFTIDGSSVLDRSGKAFIFTFIAEGTFFPCIAIIGADGRVREIIAINNYGKKILERVSPQIVNLYTRRIEGSGL